MPIICVPPTNWKTVFYWLLCIFIFRVTFRFFSVYWCHTMKWINHIFLVWILENELLCFFIWTSSLVIPILFDVDPYLKVVRVMTITFYIYYIFKYCFTYTNVYDTLMYICWQWNIYTLYTFFDCFNTRSVFINWVYFLSITQ